MTTNSISLNIISGPSKFDLMVSLFDEKNPAYYRAVKFKLNEIPIPIKVSIEMIEREDGSGQSWNFHGFMIDDKNNIKIKGYYSSITRTGTAELIFPDDCPDYLELISRLKSTTT